MKEKKTVRIDLDGYHIIVDRYNWELHSHNTHDETEGPYKKLYGQEYDITEGWFPNLSRCIQKIVHSETLKGGNTIPFDDYLLRVDRMYQRTVDRVITARKELVEAIEINKVM